MPNAQGTDRAASGVRRADRRERRSRVGRRCRKRSGTELAFPCPVTWYAGARMNFELSRLRPIANLAELSLSPAEEAAFAGDVGRILSYMTELETVDTTGIVATANMVECELESKRSGDGWRVDIVAEGLAHDDALRGAPSVESEGFAVPSFVE